MLGSNSLNPPYKSGGETNRGQEVSRQPVVSRGDAPEVLQAAEGVLNKMAFSIEAFAEAERLLAIAAVWNDRFGPAPMQFSAQLGAVISLITEHVFRRLYSAEKTLSDRAVVRFASGQ